jgi:hypothetical protein
VTDDAGREEVAAVIAEVTRGTPSKVGTGVVSSTRKELSSRPRATSIVWPISGRLPSPARPSARRERRRDRCLSKMSLPSLRRSSGCVQR